MEDKTKAIFINLSDEDGQKIYKALNILRVTNEVTWKELVLMSLATSISDEKLIKVIKKYLGVE